MADLQDLEKILDYRGLTEMYQDYGRNANNNPLFDFYTKTNVKNFTTDTVEFIKLSAVKDPAPLNSRGNPARMLQPTGKTKRQLTMVNMFDAIKVEVDTLMKLRAREEWVIDQGREEIKQQVEDFATRHVLTKQLYQSKYMTGATVYVDANGDILESSTGAVQSIATGIPAANLSQITASSFGLSGTNVIDKAWDDPTAKILDHLDLLNEAVQFQNTEPLRHIWMHPTNKIWLRANDQILDMWGLGPGPTSQERLDNALRADTFEINGYVFHFFGGTYTTTAGTTGYFVPKTKAIITPDPGPWLANGLGRQYVCNSLQPAASLEALMSSFVETYGDFTYAFPDHSPPGATLYSGSNWLFGFKNPASVFCPTVDF